MKRNRVLFIATLGLYAILLSACSTAGSSAQSEGQQAVAASEKGDRQPDASSSATKTTGSEGSETTGSSENKAEKLSNGKVLIAYFTHEGNNVFDGDPSDVDAITSASVQRKGDTFPPQVIDGVHKGNTQIIAEDISEITGGDLFAIQVTDEYKYPVDGYDTLDVVQKQRSEHIQPDLAKHVEHMEDYDVIYLGYPEWYGTMPAPVVSFLEEYDFSGKTIVPFSTHDGSGMGSSVQDIKSLCPDATVLDGLAVRYSDVQNAKDKVETWIHKIEQK